MTPNKLQLLEVKIDKLVHGGQGIGTLESGKKALVWGVLPGETVQFSVIKKRSDYVEGVAQKIIKKSEKRQEPKNPEYLSTSPWQIMDYSAENEHKKIILSETLTRAKVEYAGNLDLIFLNEPWHYRNKMEYSFFGDDSGLHLALFNRGTHHKQIVSGSSIARKEIDETANKICKILDKNAVRASDLKSIILRSNNDGKVVCAIFTRDKNFKKIDELDKVCQGVAVVFSNPKSPASVRTRDLYIYGDISLTEEINRNIIKYDVFSFFQVNLGIFQESLTQINQFIGDEPAIDFYSGVGAIGVCLKNTKLLVESDKNNIHWAKINAKNSGAKVVYALSEKALEYINAQHVLVLDPPRAGLHTDVINKILEVKPPKIAYLSCNPSTQARDIKLLENAYKIQKITGYNFFPRTPHIEALALLVRK